MWRLAVLGRSLCELSLVSLAVSAAGLYSLSDCAMGSRGKLSSDKAYVELKEYYEANKGKINIYEMFKADPDRFNKFR
jgi:hypothetical protein